MMMIGGNRLYADADNDLKDQDKDTTPTDGGGNGDVDDVVCVLATSLNASGTANSLFAHHATCPGAAHFYADTQFHTPVHTAARPSAYPLERALNSVRGVRHLTKP